MGEIMKGVVAEPERASFTTVGGSRRVAGHASPFVCMAAAITAVFSFSAAAQVSAPKAQSEEIPATIVKNPAAQGVPEEQVSCNSRRDNDHPTLRCVIRFDTPIDVVGATVVDAANKSLQWTPVFHPFDPTEDSTAFYVLIDRRAARQAEMRDLAEVFGRLQGRQQVAVSTFANDLTKVQAFTADRGAISNAISHIAPGGTASELLRNTLEAIRQLQAFSAPRKILIVASSGRSDDTAYNLDDVFKLAKQADVRIVTLGYVDQSAATPNLQILERMSNSTGGFYYRSDLRKSLPQDIRDTILTRFSGGGTLDASAPSN